MSSWCSCFMCQSVQDIPSGGLSTSTLTFGLITAGEADTRFGRRRKRKEKYSLLVILRFFVTFLFELGFFIAMR